MKLVMLNGVLASVLLTLSHGTVAANLNADESVLFGQDEQVIAREASEGPRGNDGGNRRNRGGRNGVSEDLTNGELIAREGGSHNRGRRGV